MKRIILGTLTGIVLLAGVAVAIHATTAPAQAQTPPCEARIGGEICGFTARFGQPYNTAQNVAQYHFYGPVSSPAPNALDVAQNGVAEYIAVLYGCDACDSTMPQDVGSLLPGDAHLFEVTPLPSDSPLSIVAAYSAPSSELIYTSATLAADLARTGQACPFVGPDGARVPLGTFYVDEVRHEFYIHIPNCG